MEFGNVRAFRLPMTIEEKEWRKLCSQVAQETDPQRLSELVDQIIKALDARTDEPEEGQKNRGNNL